MKRLLVSGALAVLFLFSVSMTASEIQNQYEKEAVPFVKTQQQFEEIEVADVPETVTDAVAEDYGDAKIVKAYINDDEVYKLSLQTEGNEETTNVYYSKDGKEIEF